ncbi:lycopene cyclase [Sediminibacterium roseum]|uniref:Lycopene cyclase n=1 Tax=Sediminibacterium roseum TaxID=1978412 RepID=A0ABW9ZQN6_9BACT|nr:lycopene cyclase family protein [Sediminibacterium roseum]NCI48787.1 lycopene cyclase [Sediminibacterium roseum]
MQTHYDYIITGAGCAGSSLLMRMMREPFFACKRILVIDQSQKNKNDRTWCFWEKESGLFESIVFRRWTKLDFLSNDFSATLAIDPYQYKMIRGIDLYELARTASAGHSNIDWHQGTVKNIYTENNKAIVELENEKISATYVFNSIVQLNESHSSGNWDLLQHFKGYLIESKTDAFDPARATFMDFRVHQNHGTTFVYCLPVSPTTALVEYTLFTETLLPQDVYEEELRAYIASSLHLSEYEILHEEYGVIPMTSRRFPLQTGRVVHMGVAGGQVKGSSGYAFQFIQKRTEEIVGGLMNGSASFSRRSFTDQKFYFYDRVLLNVLCNKKMEGAAIFASIFRKNPPERVLRFLDNESGLMDDLRIMRSVPVSVFLPAALQELF